MERFFADAPAESLQRLLPDSYWVLPGRFAAGEYPGHWREDEARCKLAGLLAAGVRVFFDLTEEGEYGLVPYAPLLPPEAAHRRFPVPDMDVPSLEAMRQLLDSLDAALAAGRCVYLHCWGGIGRTGTAVGCWLVRQGLSPEEALARIAAWRRGTPDGHRPSPETPDQQAFVRSWRG